MICDAVVATSSDGFIADIHGTTNWTSAEDQDSFKKLLVGYDALLMGSTTYEKHKHAFEKSEARKRYVLTSQPEACTSQQSSATFLNNSLENVLATLQDYGHKKVLFVGGSTLYYDALKQNVITTFYHTIEPIALHEGTPFLPEKLGIADFPAYKKIARTPLNKRGTVLDIYKK